MGFYSETFLGSFEEKINGTEALYSNSPDKICSSGNGQVREANAVSIYMEENESGQRKLHFLLMRSRTKKCTKKLQTASTMAITLLHG